jgi:flagellar hook-basal body complex protein FliE
MIAPVSGIGSLSLGGLGTTGVGAGEALGGSAVRGAGGSGEVLGTNHAGSASGVDALQGGGLEGAGGAGGIEGASGLEGAGGVEGAGEAAGAGTSGSGGFGEALSNAISSLDESQQSASSASQALATGQSSDPEAAVVTVDEAQLAMQLASQIRTKATEAVQQIFQTQV